MRIAAFGHGQFIASVLMENGPYAAMADAVTRKKIEAAEGINRRIGTLEISG
jgi:hypothetical protein